MSIQTKTMTVKSDTSLAETTTTIRDTVTFDVSNMPNGITYKGLKAVLSFADPIQWNKASTYDALTVVWDDASHGSYASKRPVPANIELTNEFYWLRTADLDAQVEMYRAEVQEYRQEVQAFDGRITANAQAIVAEKERAEAEEQTLQENIDNVAKKPIMVTFGDSFTDPNYGGGVNTPWATIAAAKLKLELKNYAVSGNGYTQVGNVSGLISTQITKAANELKNDKERVALIVMYAGLNDIMEQSEDNPNGGIAAATAAIAAYKQIETAFPNSHIMMLDINMTKWSQTIRPKTLGGYFDQLYQTNSHVMNILPASTEVALPSSFQYLGAQSTGHPSKEGLEYIANYVVNAYNGIGCHGVYPWMHSPDNPVTTGGAWRQAYYDGVFFHGILYCPFKDYTLTEPVKIGAVYQPVAPAATDVISSASIDVRRLTARTPAESGYGWDCGRIMNTNSEYYGKLYFYFDNQHNIWVKPVSGSVVLKSSVALDIDFTGCF